MEVSVVTGTFGDAAIWGKLAQERAGASVPEGVPWIHVHAQTLAKARNAGLERVETEWVVFLDADDELEPAYLEILASGSADLRAPAVRYVQDGRAAGARMPRVAGHRHGCTADCLPSGNWLVIGTWAPVPLLRHLGGFNEYRWSEDWDLWIRCWKAGAIIEPIPEAVYRAHVRRDSRNRGPDREFKDREHWLIHKANFPEQYEELPA